MSRYSRYLQNNVLREIKAKFASTCPQTGKPIKPGDWVIYDPTQKKAFHLESDRGADYRRMRIECEDEDLGNYY